VVWYGVGNQASKVEGGHGELDSLKFVHYIRNSVVDRDWDTELPLEPVLYH